MDEGRAWHFLGNNLGLLHSVHGQPSPCLKMSACVFGPKFKQGNAVLDYDYALALLLLHFGTPQTDLVLFKIEFRPISIYTH